MKKKILKRLGSFVLVCFMVVLNFVGFVVPATAEEIVQNSCFYDQYINLDHEETNLLAGIETYESEVDPNSSNPDVQIVHDRIGEIEFCIEKDPEFGFYYSIALPTNQYYVLKYHVDAQHTRQMKICTVEERLQDMHILYNAYSHVPIVLAEVSSRSEAFTSGIVEYSPVIFISTEYAYQYVWIPYIYEPELYVVKTADVGYNAAKTSFRKDMKELFGGRIDYRKFQTMRDDSMTGAYIDILAAYSDAVYSDWDAAFYESGNDYLYIYDCFGEFPTGGSIQYTSEVSQELIRVSSYSPFTKFRIEHPVREFSNDGNLSSFPIQSITLNFGTYSRTYSFQNFYVTIEYTNRTDWKIQKVSFGGEQKLRLNIDYTYWRQADYSAHPDHPGVIGWHNQIDSIYFGVPNALLDGQRLVDAKLEYQKVTTKPIVVTKTDEFIQTDPNGPKTYVHEWFETTAADPSNELTHNQGWVRYQKGVPYFYADPALWSKIALIDQHPTFDIQFNVRTSSPNNLHSVYWAFDVEDPTIVDKVPNPGSTTGLSSSALSHPDASVSPDRLEQWMIHYDLTGATTTYTAANPDYRVGSSVPETVQVNGILFDHAEPRGTYYASQIAGRVLEQFGNNDNFWQNLKVGWNYAFAHLFNTVDEQNVVVGFSDFEIRDISDLNDENGDHKFALADKIDLQNRFRSCMANDETLILMPFDTSQYYSVPLYGWYKEGNVDSGSEDTFNGYLAIMDMYLDLHVIELYFQNAVGEVIPVEVTSNHINGIAHVSPAPGNAELNEYAGETLKNMFQRTGKSIWGFLKKALVIIAVVVIVLIILRLVIWIVGRKRSNNTTVVIRDDAPRRNRRRRR